MNERIGFFQLDEIADRLGKRSCPSPAWTTGTKFATLSGPCWTKVRLSEVGGVTSVEERIQKRRFTELLETQLVYSDLRDEVEPLRSFVTSSMAATAAARFSTTLQELLDDQRFPIDPSQHLSLHHQQETWSLIAALLPAIENQRGEEGVLIGVQRWLRTVCRTYITQKLHSFQKLEPKERYLQTLGLLIASGLNLDGARLAIVEGEVNLGQLLMCREYPDFIPRLMGSYIENLRQEMEPKTHPLLLGIFDLLSGNGDWLLDQLEVDWRIKLAVCLSSKKDVSLLKRMTMFRQTLEVRYDLDDVQFQLIMLFCKLSAGESVERNQVLQLVKTQSSVENGLDDLMAWQLFAVLSSIEGLDASSTDKQEELSVLFNNLCEKCEALALPEWSVFVTLHRMTSPSIVESHVRRILEMNTFHWINKPEIQNFLMTNLQIPSSWITAAKAAWYRSQHDYEVEFECLAEARCFNEAHRVLFLKNRSEDLNSVDGFNLNSKLHLMTVNGLIKHQNLITKWEFGGGLVLNLQSLLEVPIRDNMGPKSLLEQVKNFKSLVLESREFWMSLTDTEDERLVLKRFFGLLMLKAEMKYCEKYAYWHGSDFVLSQVLFKGCRVREQRLVI